VTVSTGDVVTIEYVGRLDNEPATVFDTSREQVAEDSGLADAQPDREYTPLTVEVGAEQVIQGVDEGLVGLEAGEVTTLSLPPAKAYGEWSEDRVQEFDAAELEEMLGGQTPEEGAQLEAQNGQRGSVIDVDEEVVRVDFNSELAGKPLEFEIEVLEVD